MENTGFWDGILASAMFALRATHHTTLQASPTQLVFGRDAMLNIPFTVDWNKIKERKQNLINKNNSRENASRIHHTYKVEDQILVHEPLKAKYGGNPYHGPYTVLNVNNNGTIRIKRGVLHEVINIRRVKPYKVE